jgi:translocation and assembly module TamB
MSRWLKLLLLVLVVAGAGLVSLPWWLGAALRPALRARGVTFERYERAGYAHFRLMGIHYAGTGFSGTARQMQSLTPLAWIWQRLRGAEPTLMVEGLKVERLTRVAAGGAALPRDESPESGRKAPPTSNQKEGASLSVAGPQIHGLPDLHAALRRLQPRLAWWLPRAHLASGELGGFGREVTIASADWRDSTLKVEGLRIADQVVALSLSPSTEGSVVLIAHTAGHGARLRLVLSGLNLKGEAVLWEQTLQLTARFPNEGWLPAEAGAVAENWRLPAARVGLGVPYEVVRGDARLLWRDGSFEVSVNAGAEPAAGAKTKAPPFTATAAAHGNLRELTLTALQLDAPFVTASLSAPVTFSVDRPVAAESARLAVRADLSKMPWLAARGQVEGSVTVAGNSVTARQDFELKFSDVAVRAFTLKEAEARGTLAWPRLELTELKIRLDESSALEARGRVDWQTRELSGVTLEARLGAAWFARWLPAGTTWESAELTVTAEGPLDTPRHQGALKLAGAQCPPLHPFALAATWQGLGPKLEISAQARAGNSALDLAGTLVPQGLQLVKLDFSSGGRAVWQLAAPAQLAWSPAWRIDDLQLTGPDSRLILKGQGGTFELAAAGFSSAWLQDWVTLSGPAWQVQSLQAAGHVVDGALVFDASFAAEIAVSPQPALVKLVASGDAQGVRLKEFTVTATERVLTQAAGRLPLVWRTTRAPRLYLDENLPLELSASTEPDSPLWETLAAATGLRLTKAAAKADLKGTLRQPAGEARLKVEKLEAIPGRFGFSLPEFSDLELDLQFARDLIKVTRFTARLDGQAVSADGRLPMDDGQWRQLWRKPAGFDWSRAEGRLEIPDADLAPLAQRFPRFVAAQGRLHAKVALAPGKSFTGELRLADAASRPLPPLGALQDIQADLALAGHLITVRTLTAKLGGEPVTVDGSVTLVPGGAPRLALTLKGTNLPLVRNTGLLLRTDLDLRAQTDAADLTRLEGAITVRDCLVLANINLRTLLPTGRRGVRRQPPYFAVQAAPFATWALAVDVRAPGSVRVRTTAYSGIASAHFQLGGTLGEPRAVGELTVDQGLVSFPFATFKVQQGTVRLREADPFRAVVSLNATSQRRDYQLRLEMTGELPAPNVLITSTPALGAADVLLMVMTGQPPAGDAVPSTAGSGPRLALLGAYLSRSFFQNLGFSGEDRLEISAGERISRSGRETYEFEYKLGEKWSLLGEYDEFDAYNAGLKWRVYTSEGSPLERK